MTSRLTLALSQDALELPPGNLLVMNPPADVDLPDGRSDVHAVQTFFPTYMALQNRGIPTAIGVQGTFDAAWVFCHRSKRVTLDMLARALDNTHPGAMILLEGAKTDGVESILKELRGKFDGVEAFSKAHGKLAWFTRPEAFDVDTWRNTTREIADGFVTEDGVFSADGIDKGSEFLVNQLPPLKGRVADLGAGWGYLSRHILRSEAVTHLDLIEADHNALDLARLNAADPRCDFIWDDATTFQALNSKTPVHDVVISNPPFHVSRKADPALGQAFIRQAARLLKPSGQFWMVANRNLPYEDSLKDAFHHAETKSQNGSFKVIYARKPKTSRQSR